MSNPLRNVTIYLTDERLDRIDAIVQELSTRAGISISRSAAIGRAIDDLFLAVCPMDRTDNRPTDHIATN